MPSGSWSRIVATSRSKSGPSAGASTGAPEDDQLDVAGGGQLGPEALDQLGAHRRLGRPRQDAAVDLDHGVAGDDVVLEPGVDDVRADRVAQQRPDGARVHRVAGHREGRLGAPGIVARQGAQDLGRLGRQFGRGEIEGACHHRRHPDRARDREARDDRGGQHRGVVLARHRAVAPRPADGDPVGGEALLGDLDRVEPPPGDRRRDAAALVERPGRAQPLGPVLGEPFRAGDPARLLVGGRGEQDVAAQARGSGRAPGSRPAARASDASIRTTPSSIATIAFMSTAPRP